MLLESVSYLLQDKVDSNLNVTTLAILKLLHKPGYEDRSEHRW